MKMTIERLGHLGDGIAGGVFVANALPGETIEGAVEHGRIAAPRIMEPSSARVRPVCPHYRGCGGCQLMHASDAFLADWKTEVVRVAMKAQGLAGAAFRPIVTSPPRSRRRAAFSGRRTKQGALVGFHGRMSGTISEVTECQLLHPGLVAALPALRELVAAGASRQAELSLTATLSEGGIDLAVRGGKAADPALFSRLADVAERADLARLSWNDETIAARRPALQRFGTTLVAPPSGAFLQATREGELALISAIREAVGKARHIADLFAGSGTFTLPLAEAAEIHAVEAEAAALAALDAGWRQAAGLKRVSVETRDLFRRPLMADELKGFDAVVVDPPRAGAEAQSKELGTSCVPTIAMVSCNPVTFARDAAILISAGYQMEWVQVIDQFRWSPHVELVARLRR